MFGAVIVPDVFELKTWAEISWKLGEFEMQFAIHLRRAFLPKWRCHLPDSLLCLIDLFILEITHVDMGNKITRCLLQPSYTQGS